jgi:putative transposase
MTNIRRYYLPDSIIFITCVTLKRNPLFNSDVNMNLFLGTMDEVRRIYPFELSAWVILPDHFHWLITLKAGYANFSKILASFKGNFTHKYKQYYKITSPLTLWQRRFWDHVIRNENDLAIHLDYIHWNPVKHQLVSDPGQWKYSSLAAWVKEGYYQEEWGIQEPMLIKGLNFE